MPLEQLPQRNGSTGMAAATDPVYLQMSHDQTQQWLQEYEPTAVLTEHKSTTMVPERRQFGCQTISRGPAESAAEETAHE
ncbi:MAG: hypothetical protein MK110_09920 [Fuerstiella sp.]|nr:hypothetical protein [Fuerstiella sp.]